MKKKTKTGSELLSVSINTRSTLSGLSTSREHLVSDLDSRSTDVLAKVEALKQFGMHVFVLASLQLRSASRVSEMLRIQPNNIDALGRIIIRGAKGSNDKVIDTGEYKLWFLQFRRNNVQPFEGLNKQYIWRCYNKVGLSFQIEGQKTKKVTHALRYEGIQLLAPSGEEMQAKQQLSGHVAKSNTKHYDKKKLK